MGIRLSFVAEGTHEAEILQSPSTKDKAKAADGYNMFNKNFQKTYIDIQELAELVTDVLTYRSY